jgi:hypothetical protein
MGNYAIPSLDTTNTPWAVGGVAAFILLMFMLLKGVSWLPFRVFKGGLLGRVRREAEEALEEFSAELGGIRQKYSILSAYSNEYFNTFQAAGWDDLRLLIDDLQIAENSLHLLLERRRYDDVKCISEYLLGVLPEADAQELVQRYDGLESLGGWRRQARDLLLRVVHASMESARKTAAVGISRKRATKPTLVTLAELRSSLGDANQK